MNRMPIEKRNTILRLLCEGNSIRSICRLMQTNIPTVLSATRVGRRAVPTADGAAVPRFEPYPTWKGMKFGHSWRKNKGG